MIKIRWIKLFQCLCVFAIGFMLSGSHWLKIVCAAVIMATFGWICKQEGHYLERKDNEEKLRMSKNE